jgi:hypothetical protein
VFAVPVASARNRESFRGPSEAVNSTAGPILRVHGLVDLRRFEVLTACGSHGHDDIGGDRLDERDAILAEDDADARQG